MRAIAAIYDIHGNLPAIEAVLEEIRAGGIEEIVLGGDVLPGPMPRETLDRLLAIEPSVRFILAEQPSVFTQPRTRRRMTSQCEMCCSRPLSSSFSRHMQMPSCARSTRAFASRTPDSALQPLRTRAHHSRSVARTEAASRSHRFALRPRATCRSRVREPRSSA